ncbi:MAG: S-layer homology domain-containing protein [Acidimicrobiales bacterium]
MLRPVTPVALVAAALAAVLSTSSPAGGVAGFGDVASGQYYTSGVQWMVDHSITNGTSPTCFSPEDLATRGQIAAFMWRMEGEPKAPPHTFVDVTESWQQGPVSWMADVGVTNGTSASTFSPDDLVTRGQLAAMLHRLAGEPAAPPATQFTDVFVSWQIAPVGWMLDQGITTGTSATTFSPEAPATRGQIATFFHRYKGSPVVTIDPSSPPCGAQTSSEGLTVAFIGDQGSGRDARAVLELIRDRGADMVLHQGDFDYKSDPDAWDQLISDVLGTGFPYFASVGNHDDSAWDGSDGYQAKLIERLARVPEASCSGDLGVKSSCTFRGLFFILSGVGTMGSGHDTYIRDQLAQTNARWRICSWHKNQKEMQIGGKSSSTGWDVYEECRRQGAIIATAHEHSYERTRTLVDVSEQTVDPVWSSSDRVRVAPGATFVFVSGLGGKSVRDQERCLPTSAPYGCNGEWASIYTSDQGAADGALFCSFGTDATAQEATCWFEDVDGNVPDRFTVSNFNG